MFNNLALLASEICETPVAHISLIDERRQWLKAHVGFAEIELPLHESFCRHAALGAGLFVVRDACRDPRFADHRLVVEEPHVRFYAGAPLIAPGGIPLGAICAIDFRPRGLSRGQGSALRSLARQTVALLELRRLERLSKRRAAPKTLMGRCRRSRDLIGAVAEIAAVALDAEGMLNDALGVVCQAIGARIGHVWIPDSHLHGSAAPLHVRHVHDDALAITLEQPGAADDSSSLWASLLRDVPMSITEIPSDYLQVADVVVPMPGRGLPGLLGLYHPQAITLGPDLRAALKQVGALIGQAMQRLHSQTVLQLSETYFRHLVEDALDLITVLDPEGIIQFESHSITEQLGWAPEDILGHNAFEFVHPDDCTAVLAAFSESLRVEGPTPILCFRFRHKNGSYCTLEGRGNNLLNDPSVRGVVFSSRNITEKRRLEQQFGQLAGGIAHDFNNLLSVIVGYSSKAEAHPQADAKLKAAVEQIQRASERAAGLTGQLLAFTGRQILQPRILCLDELLTESEPGWSLLLGSRMRLKLRTGAAGACVDADVTQIDMVMRHLVLNARDALEPGGEVVIESRTVKIDGVSKVNVPPLAPGDYCLIEVRDNGSGMSPEVCSRVFEPYFTTKPLGKGSGMGLATCQGILKQSGGGIAIQSVLERGTSASLYLPLAARGMVEGTDNAAPLRPRADGRPTVLFAEDEEALREFGVSILEEMGCRVLAGENGRAALELLDAEPGSRVDLLLTDIVMPEMDGKQLADIVRARHPAMPILFCSGYAHDPTFYAGLPPGASFLPKPYSAAMLSETVRRTLP